jgi:hypothetical protein
MEITVILLLLAFSAFVIHIAKTIVSDRKEHREYLKQLRRSGYLTPFEPGSTKREFK